LKPDAFVENKKRGANMKRAKVLRRTVGVAGVVFWAGAVVLAILFGFQKKASGEQIFENLPEGWKV